MLNISFTPFPVLETERLHLRQLTTEDANEIFILRSDESVNEFIDRPRAKTIDDALQHIEKINSNVKNNESILWAITMKEDSKLIGTICLWNIDKEKEHAETGYELLPQFQGKGFMQEAFLKVLEYGFENLKLKAIEAVLHEKNLRSIKLLEKNNFIRDFDAENKMDKTENANLIIYSLKKIK
jgi:ribosomal-protein-alanine N-acetyltransferase